MQLPTDKFLTPKDLMTGSHMRDHNCKALQSLHAMQCIPKYAAPQLSWDLGCTLQQELHRNDFTCDVCHCQKAAVMAVGQHRISIMLIYNI